MLAHEARPSAQAISPDNFMIPEMLRRRPPPTIATTCNTPDKTRKPRSGLRNNALAASKLHCGGVAARYTNPGGGLTGVSGSFDADSINEVTFAFATRRRAPAFRCWSSPAGD